MWLLADITHPRTPREVAEIVGRTPDWVRKLLKHYNAQGEAAMQDKRKNNKGQRFLDETQQAALEVALQRPLLMAVF
ncbi:MAG: helix-turn-helix domain-containing protein [Candidatus Poribacteria bacterium]|nr:helix-turn-helix domain-containing protein [Candidatus Poribacteria bacterium]